MTTSMIGLALLLAAGGIRVGHAGLVGSIPATPALARAAFERLKTLQGTWEGSSTRGSTERFLYEVIAGGSVVMETSREVHAGGTMATMFHMDGGDLVLTHYCIAGNQPTMKATAFQDGGRTVIFTFTRGSNLPSRDVGHMDSAVLTFEGPDRLRARWGWYEDGAEQWADEMVRTRRQWRDAGGGGPAASGGAPPAARPWRPFLAFA